MTDLELLEILERPASNLEKALAIRTLLKIAQPSALNIKPQAPRKKREAKQPKAGSPSVTLPLPASVSGTLVVNGAGHEGPTQ